MPNMQAIQEQVQERLTELGELINQLSEESAQLKKIAAMLEHTQNANGAAAAVAAPARRTPAKRAPRAAKPAGKARPQRGGNRGQQALELIAAKPGLTAAELADSMGMKRNYLYRVLPALEKDGKIAKQGSGYHPAGDRAAA